MRNDLFYIENFNVKALINRVFKSSDNLRFLKITYIYFITQSFDFSLEFLFLN